jgi:hypothetical protein
MDIEAGTAIGFLSRLRPWVCERLCGCEGDRQLTRDRQHRLMSLREEIRENQVVAAHPILEGLVPARFQLSAWDAAKGDMEAYETDQRVKLRAVFGKLRACNQLIDDVEKRKDGRVLNVVELRVNEMRSSLEDVHGMLRDVRFTD